jgi:hypothetical protein
VSITTAVRSLNRSALKKFPGATAADVAEYVKLVFAAAAANLRPDYKDSEAVVAADEKLAEAAESGEAWAERLRDSVLVNVVKPIVDKAVAKGLDPVAALVFADFTEDQACDYVNALNDRADTAGADDSEAEADTADVPAQAEPVAVSY